MPDMHLACVTSALALVGLVACAPVPPSTPLTLKLYQSWELQPGDQLQGYTVLGGLGDITIALQGKAVYAPFDGKVQAHTRECVIFSSPDVPAYLFRLCGVKQPKFGAIAQGSVIGTADTLQFAALRKQAENTWAIVEPSQSILQRILARP
jgi:hypothetical protein